MKLTTVTIAVLLSSLGIVAPVKAQAPATVSPPTREQIANACIQNQAETLPRPFSDVSATHWAFKAVMTMYYCGTFRQAAPPALFQQVPTQSQQQSQSESQPQLRGLGKNS